MSRSDNHRRPGYAALRHGRFSEAGRCYLITTATHNREPIFRDFELAHCAILNLVRQNERTASSWLAWVLMPDHFHGLLQLRSSDELSLHVGWFKGRSAWMINSVRGGEGVIWQKSFHDHALRREEDLKMVARYLINNPLRAGLVESVGDYPYWNAVWL
jgi:REP element-mobilizing transposase RayT